MLYDDARTRVKGLENNLIRARARAARVRALLRLRKWSSMLKKKLSKAQRERLQAGSSKLVKKYIDKTGKARVPIA